MNREDLVFPKVFPLSSAVVLCVLRGVSSAKAPWSTNMTHPVEFRPFIPSHVFAVCHHIGNIITMRKEHLKVVFGEVRLGSFDTRR
jgi:hypothetical protein